MQFFQQLGIPPALGIGVLFAVGVLAIALYREWIVLPWGQEEPVTTEPAKVEPIKISRANPLGDDLAEAIAQRTLQFRSAERRARALALEEDLRRMRASADVEEIEGELQTLKALAAIPPATTT